MKTEFLKNLGIEDDEVITRIMAESGKDIEKYKTLSETQKTELENTKTQLGEANKQIEDFKDMNIDEIKKSANEYKTKFEQAEQDYQAKIAQMEYDNKLDKYVGTLNLKNDIYKKAMLDQIKEKQLKFDGDTLLGGEDLVKGFKTSYAEAFNDETPPPQFTGNINQPGNNTLTKEVFNKMGYKERCKLQQKQPEIYNQLKE